MSEQDPTYMEKQTEAILESIDDRVEVKLQRAKIKLRDELEIDLLKTINPEFKKEFALTDDLLTIHIYPPSSYAFFASIHQKSTQAKYQFAYNIIQTIQQHGIHRIHLIICPENIMFDSGLVPYFLHYGVKESIPPYVDDQDRIWNEAKAIIATIIDEKHNFETYLNHHETIDLSDKANQIMEADSYAQLTTIMEESLEKEKEYQDTVVPIPVKKWKIQRYSALVLTLLLIPTLLYTAFALFFKIPETEAYVESNRSFLQEQYSSVISTLKKYDHEKMPYVVQYQLAKSYIANESLTEEQKKNIQNVMTLQTDERYFSYWIDIGRGNYEEATDNARLLEDRNLILYGLYKYRPAVKSDESIKSDEKKNKLQAIDKEIDDYETEIEQEEETAKMEQEELEKENSMEDDERTGEATETGSETESGVESESKSETGSESETATEQTDDKSNTKEQQDGDSSEKQDQTNSNENQSDKQSKSDKDTKDEK